MKSLENLSGFVPLNREQQSLIFGGCDPTVECDDNWDPGGGGGSQCSQTGCENKKSGESCVIGGSAGTCKMGSCAGTRQLLCYT